MKPKQETLTLAVNLASDGEPPHEFRIFAAGDVKTRKGVFRFDDKAAEEVIAEASEFGNEFSLDYAHAMVSGLALNPAEAGKAAGWFKAEVRDGELWATDVTWTPSAQQYLRNREYRYMSPTFEHKDKRISRLINVALTNIPASHKLQPLMADARTYEASQVEFRIGGELVDPQSYAPSSDVHKSLPARATAAADSAHKDKRISRLINVALTNIPASHKLQPLMAHSLEDEASAALERVTTRALQAQLDLPTRATAAADSAEREDTMKTVAIALGMASEAAESEVLSRVTLLREVAHEIQKLTGKESTREALGTLHAWKEENTKLEEARTRVAELETNVRQRDVEEKVEAKIRDGYLPPSQRDQYVKLGMRDGEMFEAFLEGLKTRVVMRGEVDADKMKARPRMTAGGMHIEVPDTKALAMLGFKSADEYVEHETKLIEQGRL
jgi:phage I-like protein